MSMSGSSSVSEASGDHVRLRNINCSCGIRASVKIVESMKNKHRVYYACAEGICGTFIGWAIPVKNPATTATTSIPNVAESNDIVQRLNSEVGYLKEGVKEMKEEMKASTEMNRLICFRMEKLDSVVEYFKNLVLLSIGAMMLLLLCLVVSLIVKK